MTTNTDKLAAHMALVDVYARLYKVNCPYGLQRDAIEASARALAAIPAERAPAPTVAEAHTDRAPLGFTDHEKSAWSIGVEHGMRIAAPTAQEASKPVQAEAARGTDAQILKERELTASAISGAIAFGYLGNEAPPPDSQWLQEFYDIGVKLKVLEAQKPPAIPAAPAVQASGEREAFEAAHPEYDFTRKAGGASDHYRNSYVQGTWEGWQARAALASPPASGEKQG